MLQKYLDQNSETESAIYQCIYIAISHGLLMKIETWGLLTLTIFINYLHLSCKID